MPAEDGEWSRDTHGHLRIPRDRHPFRRPWSPCPVMRGIPDMTRAAAVPRRPRVQPCRSTARSVGALPWRGPPPRHRTTSRHHRRCGSNESPPAHARPGPARRPQLGPRKESPPEPARGPAIPPSNTRVARLDSAMTATTRQLDRITPWNRPKPNPPPAGTPPRPFKFSAVLGGGDATHNREHWPSVIRLVDSEFLPKFRRLAEI